MNHEQPAHDLAHDHLHIGVSLDGAGRHRAAWREPGVAPERLFSAEHIVGLVQLAERGLLDFVTLADSFRLQSDRTDHVRGHLDALLSFARVAPVTNSIGLVPTVTTTHTEPFHVSKNLATLDLVSDGRAGWLVDVSTTGAEAIHFGRRPVASFEDLFAEAAEAIDVVSQLWDSWEDDAVICDRPTGRYLDRDKLHYTHFEGRFFSVRGPSITPRSPQAQPPVMVRAVNEHALAVGVQRADVILIDAATVDDARSIREQIRGRVLAAGRDDAAVSVLAVIDVLLGDSDTDARSTRARLDAAAPPSPAGPDSAGLDCAGLDFAGLDAAGLDFAGTAAGVADLFEQWSALGAVDGFLVRPAILPETLRRVVDDVVPLLQQRGIFRTHYEGRTLRDHFGLTRPTNRYAASGAVGAAEPSVP